MCFVYNQAYKILFSLSLFNENLEKRENLTQ